MKTFIFKSNHYEAFNRPFTLAELTEIIKKLDNTTVGQAEIHYVFFEYLLRIIGIPVNCIQWYLDRCLIPDSWKISTITSYSDQTKHLEYRKLPLNSTNNFPLKKHGMHGQQNIGLVHSIQQTFTNSQCGFRSQSSTMWS